MSYLTIIQGAVDMIGNVRRPETVARSQDPTVRTMSALLNRAGQNLARERGTWGAGWSVLHKEHVFETVPGQASYMLPNDFQEIVGRTIWDRTTYWRLRGSVSPGEWQEIKSGLIESSTLYQRFVIRRSPTSGDRVFYIDPPPSSTEELVFEYTSKDWVLSEDGGISRDRFQEDSDTALLDEDLLTMDVVWRYRHAKGLEYIVDMTEWEQQKMRLLGQDSNVDSITLGRRRYLSAVNIPETGYGGVSR